jgi:hypothetical protein
MDEFYEKLFSLVCDNERLVKMKLINVQDKLLDLYIYKSINDEVKMDVLYKKKKIATISFYTDTYDDSKEQPLFKTLLSFIEESFFCFDEFCDSFIIDKEDLIDEKCINCYYKKQSKKTMKSECSICLEKNTINSVELKCNHIFHKHCLKKSTSEKCIDHLHIKCPLCRCEYKLKLNLEDSYQYCDYEDNYLD